MTVRAFPDKIDHIPSWSGMQRIRIGRSWSETRRWPRLLERICGNLAKHGLELGKQLLDRIEVRAVCRKVEQNCTPGFDRLCNAFDHVNARIVHEYDIVLLQSRSEELFDVGLERF